MASTLDPSESRILTVPLGFRAHRLRDVDLDRSRSHRTRDDEPLETPSTRCFGRLAARRVREAMGVDDCPLDGTPDPASTVGEPQAWHEAVVSLATRTWS